jgi:hypothetical protein
VSVADAFSDDLRTERRRTIPLEVRFLTVILAITLGVVAGAGAALYQRTRPTNYFSIAVLAIDQPIQVSGDVGDTTLLKLQRLRGYYTQYLKTEVLASPIAHQLNLPVGRVEADITPVNNASNYLIELVTTDRSPSQAESIAQAATSQLVSFVRKKQPNIPASDRVILTEVTNPSFGAKIRVSSDKVLTSAVVAFIVVAAAFIIVADLLRRRW